jgi:hypothetical protein
VQPRTLFTPHSSPPRPASTSIRTAAVASLLVTAGLTWSLVSTLVAKPSPVSGTLPAGIHVPSDSRYREIVESLLGGHGGVRLKSLTLSEPGGRVRLERATGQDGFPAEYLNPVGVAQTAQSLMGVDESISIREMHLAQGPNGHLVWRLTGRRDDYGDWVAEIAPNGTGLRTIRPARH